MTTSTVLNKFLLFATYVVGMVSLFYFSNHIIFCSGIFINIDINQCSSFSNLLNSVAPSIFVFVIVYPLLYHKFIYLSYLLFLIFFYYIALQIFIKLFYSADFKKSLTNSNQFVNVSPIAGIPVNNEVNNKPLSQEGNAQSATAPTPPQA